MIESVQNILLYNIYKKFYDKKPNLNEENSDNLNIEIQSLVFLLNWLGTNISSYNFEIDEEMNMPISKKLKQDIETTLVGKNIEILDKYKIDINDDILNVLNLLKNKLENKDGLFLKELSNSLYNKYGFIEYEEIDKRKLLF